MDDLISRTWLLAEYDKRHKGPPGGARKLIEEAPSALGTNLAEVGTDCISRQAAIDAMNAKLEDIKLRWRGKVKKGEIAMYLDMRGTIETLPSAQPEIIRCRNCKFASGDSRICMKFGHSPIGELDFCAWAERRTDG